MGEGEGCLWIGVSLEEVRLCAMIWGSSEGHVFGWMGWGWVGYVIHEVRSALGNCCSNVVICGVLG